MPSFGVETQKHEVYLPKNYEFSESSLSDEGQEY